jgi:hypothetical protein
LVNAAKPSRAHLLLLAKKFIFASRLPLILFLKSLAAKMPGTAKIIDTFASINVFFKWKSSK